MRKIQVILIGEEAPKVVLKTNQTPLTFAPAETGIVNDEEKKVHVEEYDLQETSDNLTDNVSIPRDVLEFLVKAKKEKSDKSDEKFEKALDRLTRAYENSNPVDNRYLGARPVDITQIDPEDVLSVPDVFFAHSVSYSIFDDRRNGITVSTPYKRSFKFKKVIRTVTTVPGSRTPVYMSISAAIVNSKKEADWLRGHSLFGIKFFEKLGDSKDISAEMQDKLVTAWNIISSFDEHSIIQRCAREGITVDTMDMTEMRRRLAKKMASNMLKDAQARSRKTVQEFDNFIQGNIETIAAPKSTNENPVDLKVAEPIY